jgi:hypothetical protein
MGTRQLVVHDALETMLCRALSYLSEFTPITIVMSSPLAGAEMITFLAPACRCASALSASVNRPVDSSTMSTPRSPHGSLAGSFSAKILMASPSIVTPPSLDATWPG